MIAYVDQLAVKKADIKLNLIRIVQGGPNKIIVPIKSQGIQYQLWQKIADKEEWFVKCEFQKDGSREWIDIPIDKCTPVQVSGKATGYCESVEIDVSHLLTVTGYIKLIVNGVDRFCGGIAFMKNNIIAIATRANWEPIDKAPLISALVHEFGHKIGLVPKTAPNYYTGCGHVGPHCHAGLGEHLDYREAKGSTCVMFGEITNVRVENINFCPDCQNEVKNANLLRGVLPQ